MIPRSAAQDQFVNSCRADEVFAEHGSISVVSRLQANWRHSSRQVPREPGAVQ